MKHGQNPRRGRSRGNGKRHSSPRNQTFDSNGPEGKVRGTPQQILDKYLSLARDAASAGEHIAAEGFFQFAEHYFRILNADQQNRQRAEQQENRRDQRADGENNEQDEQTAKASDDSDAPAGGRQDDETPGNGKERSRRSRGNGRRREAADDADAEANAQSGNSGAGSETAGQGGGTEEPPKDPVPA